MKRTDFLAPFEATKKFCPISAASFLSHSVGLMFMRVFNQFSMSNQRLKASSNRKFPNKSLSPERRVNNF